MKRSPRYAPAPKVSVETQFEEPVDELAAYYSEIRMEGILDKPREPIAEQPESIVYLENAFDRDPGVRLGERSEVSI